MISKSNTYKSISLRIHSKEVPYSIGKIVEYIYDLFPSEMRYTLSEYFVETHLKDLVVSGRVQCGKTKLITSAAWLSLYKRDKEIPIIISSEYKNILDQTYIRIKKFDEKLYNVFGTNKYQLNPYIIDRSQSPSALNNIFEEKRCLMSILTKARIQYIAKIIKIGVKKGFKFRVIVDEGDISVKSKKTSVEKKMCKLHEKFRDNIYFVYISATNFALYNSDYRLQLGNFTHIQLPINLYSTLGLKYRGFADFVHIPTNSLIGLNDFEKIDDTQKCDLIATLMDFYTMKHSTQPNIGLMNVSYLNTNKCLLAQYITSKMPYIYILVHKSPTSDLYFNGTKTSFTYNSSKCIGSILDIFKNEYRHRKIHLPILILSTGLAGRAQTFKTTDNMWVLTHHFFDMPIKNASVENIIQALRGCGQYLQTQPKLKFYASPLLLQTIKKSIYNNEQLTHNIHVSFSHSHTRDIITNTNIIHTESCRLKFSKRPQIDDTHIIKQKHTDASAKNLNDIYQHASLLTKWNKCHTFIEIAILYHLPITLFKNTILHLDPLYRQQFNTNDPYRNIKPSHQGLLRKKIVNHLHDIFNNIHSPYYINSDDTCQICYSQERQAHLNLLYIFKQKRYKSRIIALEYNNTQFIPVVIYNKHYIMQPNHKIYQNKVLIWPGTDQIYRCYANTTQKHKNVVRQLTH